MRRRRLFALVGGASAAVALPAVAAPVVEMHANDVTPLSPSEVNDAVRLVSVSNRIWFKYPSVERVYWSTIGEPEVWRFVNG
jgi:anti-sigma factor RsiW